LHTSFGSGPSSFDDIRFSVLFPSCPMVSSFFVVAPFEDFLLPGDFSLCVLLDPLPLLRDHEFLVHVEPDPRSCKRTGLPGMICSLFAVRPILPSGMYPAFHASMTFSPHLLNLYCFPLPPPFEPVLSFKRASRLA